MEVQLCCSVSQLDEGWPWPAWVIGNAAMHFLMETHTLHSSTMSLHCQNHTCVTTPSRWASLRVASTECFRGWCQEPQHLGFITLTRHKTCSTLVVVLVFISSKIFTCSSGSPHCTNKPDTALRLSGRWSRWYFTAVSASDPSGTV